MDFYFFLSTDEFVLMSEKYESCIKIFVISMNKDGDENLRKTICKKKKQEI